MVLSTIDEANDRPPRPLQVETRFTPKSTQTQSNHNAYTMNPPYSTRNITYATEPLSTSSIVFSMKQQASKEKKHIFFNGGHDDQPTTAGEDADAGFRDIFRRWEDGSVKSSASSVGGQSTISHLSHGTASGSRKHRNTESHKARGAFQERAPTTRKAASKTRHRRAKSESATIPRIMDDWMNDKLDKYDQFKKMPKMELTPPKEAKKIVVSVKNEIGTLPHQRCKSVNQEQQRDDNDMSSRSSCRSSDLRSKKAAEEAEDYERRMQYYQTLGQNESLQKHVKAQDIELKSLRHRLQDMEKWYQSKLEDLGKEHREAGNMYHNELQDVTEELERNHNELKEAKAEIMELQAGKQIAEDRLENEMILNSELSGCKMEVDKLTREKDEAVAARESLEHDLTYSRSEREKMETMNRNQMAELMKQHQSEKDNQQAIVTNLIEEKNQALYETQECKARIHAITRELEMEIQKGKQQELSCHELNEWKMRHSSETSKWERRVMSLQCELKEEIARNSAATEDKNAMADMLDKAVSKMEHMHSVIIELEKQNTLLETENIKSKSPQLQLDEYHTQMSDLQKRNIDLERESSALKQELIDVLEAASVYQ